MAHIKYAHTIANNTCGLVRVRNHFTNAVRPQKAVWKSVTQACQSCLALLNACTPVEINGYFCPQTWGQSVKGPRRVKAQEWELHRSTIEDKKKNQEVNNSTPNMNISSLWHIIWWLHDSYCMIAIKLPLVEKTAFI